MYELLLPISPSSRRATLAAQFLSTESSFMCKVETVRDFFKTASLAILGKGSILEELSAADVTISRLWDQAWHQVLGGKVCGQRVAAAAESHSW